MTGSIVDRNRRPVVGVAQMRANVIRCYEMATRAEWWDGFTWYDRANELVHDVAGRLGVQAENLACMLAAGSFGVRWEQQEALAYAQGRVILSGLPLRDIPGHPLTLLQRQTMQATLMGGPRFLRGRKWVDFAGAMLGDKQAAPIDAHMVRALLGGYLPYKMCGITPCLYEEMHGVVCTAARALGLYPSRMQAIVWTVARNRSKTLDLS
jgi:hypothetical protein